MKKFALLGAFAALAPTGSVLAQSSITVFGVVDVAVSGFRNNSDDLNRATALNPLYQNKGSVTASQHAVRDSGSSTSRIGFRGTEDLGGGLAAGFWLEAPVSVDTGAGGLTNFSRRSTVSLSGAFGEVRIGRDYTPTFWNDSIFDPWAQIGSGANLTLASGTTSPGNGFAANPNYARASNGVGYFLPSGLGGFYGQAMYTFHENVAYDPGSATPPGAAASVHAGRYVGGRVGYLSGPLDIAFGYAESTLSDNYFAGTADVVQLMNLGASYDFGVAKLSANMARSNYSRDYAVQPVGARVADVDVSAYLLALTVPVGPGLIRTAYSVVQYDRHTPAIAPFTGDPKASKIALGYIHNLSKRTALYVNVARVSNKNGSSLTVNGAPAFISNATFTPGTSTGYDIGIHNAF